MLRRFVAPAAGMAMSACSDLPLQSITDPAGPHALAVDRLWNVLLWSCAFVWIAVLFALIYSLLAKRDVIPAERRERRAVIAVVVGSAATVVILFGLLAASVRAGNRIASLEQSGALTVDVIGRMWWWDVRYPGTAAVTANEIHIPTGVPVRIRTTSEDVIHSVWVPRLGGKIDSMPGHRTSLWIQADEPGVYRGQCAEFCGVQHANMAMFVIALPPEEFQQWLQREAAGADASAGARAGRGREVFLTQGCASCHRVRGDERAVAGVRGPDLTHLASRRTLAAGTLPNDRGHLGGWVLDPQSIKPGTLMPASHMSGEDLEALLDYLHALH